MSDGPALISHLRQSVGRAVTLNSPSSSDWKKRPSDEFAIPAAKRNKISKASDRATEMAGRFQDICESLLEEIEVWLEEKDHRSDAIKMRKVVKGWTQVLALMPAKLQPKALNLLDLRLPLPAWLSSSDSECCSPLR